MFSDTISFEYHAGELYNVAANTGVLQQCDIFGIYCVTVTCIYDLFLMKAYIYIYCICMYNIIAISSHGVS
jgi:hypothetical protein